MSFLGNIDRRRALSFAAGSLVAGMAGAARAVAPSLADLAQEKGMRFGAIIGTWPISEKNADFDDATYRALVQRECNLVVPENELKMVATYGTKDSYGFENADRIIAFAEASHLAIRGHNLIWNDNYTPKWLLDYDFGLSPKIEAERLVRAYIGRVTQRYGARLTSWDVVNEAIDPVTGGLRSTVFTRILGPDIFRIAFAAAREHLPATQLVYNDFMGWARNGARHRDGVLALLRHFRDSGLPVNALGVQSHLGTGFDDFDTARDAWQRFLETVVGLGFDLVVTELDVNDGGLKGSTANRDAKVAGSARAYLDQMMAFHQLKDVVAWGLVDKYSWIQAYLPREDHAPSRPAPFDSDFRPKPFYDAIAGAFKAASKRSA